MSNKIFLTVTVLVTFFLVTCNSLKCYKCASIEGNPNYCHQITPENQAARVECTQKNPACIHLNRRGIDNGVVVFSKIFRDCTQKTEHTCDDYEENFNAKAPVLVNKTIELISTCLACENNLCNSSTNLMSCVFGTIFMLAVTKML